MTRRARRRFDPALRASGFCCFVHGCAVALVTLAASGEPALAESPPSPLPLAWCLDEADAANPSIALDDASHQVASQRIGYTGSLEDPRFRYEASNVPVEDWDFDSTPLSGHEIGLSQLVPFPGVLANRRAAAEAGAEAAELALADRRRSVASAVEGAWAELGFTQRASRITDRNVALLRQLVRVAEAKYRVGTGLQQDALRAQVELTVLLDQKLTRTAAVERASARLAALLDLPPGTRFPETEALSDESAVPDLSGIDAGLDSRNSQLLSLAERIEEARRLARAEHFEGFPDFDLGVAYRARKNVEGDPVNGDDFVSASVTIRLPVDRFKWDARVAERNAMVRRAEAEFRVARASLSEALRSAHADLVRADSAASLLRSGLVPQAHQSLESSRSGYEVGRVDFLSLLDSQVRLQNAELRLVRAQADRRQAFSALEAASGERLR